MTGVSGLGDWPVVEVLAAQQAVVGELADTPEGVEGLPFAVRPAGRGPAGTLLGRALAMLLDLPAEVGPHGWVLAARPGRDHARARALAAQDLDALAVAAHGYTGPLVLPVLGPVSLATQVWLARGDRGVSDRGALRELAQSSGLGLAEHVAALLRAVPGAVPQVVLLEPGLEAAVSGTVPTFSGRDRLRAVPAAVCAEHLAVVVRAVRSAGAAHVAVHVGVHAQVADVAAESGADGFGLVPAGVPAWEQVATLVERGLRFWSGDGGAPGAAAPGGAPGAGPSDAAQPAGPGAGRGGPEARARSVSVPWGRVGLPPAGLGAVVLVARSAPTAEAARAELAAAVASARILAEQSAG